MSRNPSLILFFGLSVWLMGCMAEKPSSKKEGSPEALETDPKEQSVFYEEGKGLLLKPETAEAIGLQFTSVSEQPLSSRVELEAQVFLAAGDTMPVHNLKQRIAYASAVIPADQAKQLHVGDPVTLGKGKDELSGSLSKISSYPGGRGHQTSLTLEIADPKSLLHVGEFIHVAVIGPLAKKPTLSIPKAALLETITGSFVFVERDGHLLRIPVVAGTVAGESVEITEGLTVGDKVVLAPVELIYLTELRLTKGGGHAD
jgi:hypothetical protein